MICPICGGPARLVDNVTAPLDPQYICESCNYIFNESESKDAEYICRTCHKFNLCSKQAAALDRGEHWVTCSDYDKADIDPEWKFDQTAKADEGKLELTLVPTQIIEDIAEVRMYGNKKYGDPDNWKTVEIERFRNAMFRHFIAYLNDPHGVDEESGIPHWKHVVCNAAFISAMETYDK